MSLSHSHCVYYGLQNFTDCCLLHLLHDFSTSLTYWNKNLQHQQIKQDVNLLHKMHVYCHEVPLLVVFIIGEYHEIPYFQSLGNTLLIGGIEIFFRNNRSSTAPSTSCVSLTQLHFTSNYCETFRSLFKLCAIGFKLQNKSHVRIAAFHAQEIIEGIK